MSFTYFVFTSFHFGVFIVVVVEAKNKYNNYIMIFYWQQACCCWLYVVMLVLVLCWWYWFILTFFFLFTFIWTPISFSFILYICSGGFFNRNNALKSAIVSSSLKTIAITILILATKTIIDFNLNKIQKQSCF